MPHAFVLPSRNGTDVHPAYHQKEQLQSEARLTALLDISNEARHAILLSIAGIVAFLAYNFDGAMACLCI